MNETPSLVERQYAGHELAAILRGHAQNCDIEGTARVAGVFRQAADQLERYEARIAELEDEMARRDDNEWANFITPGPCSRHDGRMDDAAPSRTTLESKG